MSRQWAAILRFKKKEMAAMFSGASTDFFDFIESGCIMSEKSSFKPSMLNCIQIIN
jgi:hypothetical protein